MQICEHIVAYPNTDVEQEQRSSRDAMQGGFVCHTCMKLQRNRCNASCLTACGVSISACSSVNFQVLYGSVRTFQVVEAAAGDDPQTA